MKDIQSLLRDYLQKPDVMQLATVHDGQPWACTVHFYADENLQIYWMSTPERRHSLEVKDDKRVAVAVAIRAERDKPPIGVQMEGDAERIDDEEEMKRIIPLYAQKFDRSQTLLDEVLSGQNENRLYRLKPRLYVVFDPESFQDNPRQEWRP
jgi:uncharacterized protein YhbP (UPF0306 family)